MLAPIRASCQQEYAEVFGAVGSIDWMAISRRGSGVDWDKICT